MVGGSKAASSLESLTHRDTCTGGDLRAEGLSLRWEGPSWPEEKVSRPDLGGHSCSDFGTPMPVSCPKQSSTKGWGYGGHELSTRICKCENTVKLVFKHRKPFVLMAFLAVVGRLWELRTSFLFYCVFLFIPYVSFILMWEQRKNKECSVLHPDLWDPVCTSSSVFYYIHRCLS